ncbi:MAG: Fe-S-containing hydro-lyase [Clostridia bacterium]|nr:Fe-S-containing hydro-lyase [Clostridia bacterium]
MGLLSYIILSCFCQFRKEKNSNFQEENMSEYHLSLPLSAQDVDMLRAGDIVYLTGLMLTGRDAAHKRLVQLLEEGKPLPVDVRGQAIYYVGPAPASPGHAVGSAGPTTSYRMDAYTPQLLKLGLNCMIGKGRRSDAVRAAMREYGAVYLGAVGGAAALIARSIKSAEVLAYPDLGTEAIHRFTVENFPTIVLMDAHGGNLYESGPALYREE